MSLEMHFFLLVVSVPLQNQYSVMHIVDSLEGKLAGYTRLVLFCMSFLPKFAGAHQLLHISVLLHYEQQCCIWVTF
jgi:hypothetical protein